MVQRATKTNASIHTGNTKDVMCRTIVWSGETRFRVCISDAAVPRDGPLNKQNEIDKKINTLKAKLNNQNYTKKAPKDIVLNDKKLLSDLKIEESKLKSIVSSII